MSFLKFTSFTTVSNFWTNYFVMKKRKKWLSYMRGIILAKIALLGTLKQLFKKKIVSYLKNIWIKKIYIYIFFNYLSITN